tara:strand:+ start:54 stop:323 length:270 start_codon:yes stop_codon:yes gene_type:complete
MSDEDELLRLGDGAKTLLESEVFTKTINDLVNQSFHTFCNSAPDDQKARDLAYHHYRALTDIVHTLQQRVSVRDEIVAKGAADNQQKDS